MVRSLSNTNQPAFSAEGTSYGAPRGWSSCSQHSAALPKHTKLLECRWLPPTFDASICNPLPFNLERISLVFMRTANVIVLGFLLAERCLGQLQFVLDRVCTHNKFTSELFEHHVIQAFKSHHGPVAAQDPLLPYLPLVLPSTGLTTARRPIANLFGSWHFTSSRARPAHYSVEHG